MKIEWVEDKSADLSGQEGVFNVAADKSKAREKANTPKKLVPMLRTCHGDLVKAPYCALPR